MDKVEDEIMSQDSKINMQDIESLIENLPDNVKNIFSSMIGGENSDTKPELKTKEIFNNNNMDMILTITNMMTKLNNTNDHRMDLIKALKPFLRESRQDKVGYCINALKISKMLNEAISFINPNRQKEVRED